MKNFISYFKLFFADKSSLLFLSSVILGLAFSISVIISTFSLMEGFVVSLESSLQQNRGDLSISGRRHFFKFKDISSTLKRLDITSFSTVITSESFLVGADHSQGVLVEGIEPKSYKQVTKTKILVSRDFVAVGKELANLFELKVGDEVDLLFAAGNKSLNGTPVAYTFKISSIIDSQLYQQSLRVVYVAKEQLQELLNLNEKINQVVLKLPTQYVYPSRNDIQSFSTVLQDELGYEYVVRTFWEKYSGLLRAVKIEKFYIVAILQVIVVVSIFNIMALLLFISEKKASQIFLLQVLGMTKDRFTYFWYSTVSLFWLIASILSLGFTFVFSLLLEKWDLFQLPGSVYHLSKLELSLNLYEVLGVFSVVLIWMYIVTWWSMKRWKNDPLIQRMRKEYS